MTRLVKCSAAEPDIYVICMACDHVLLHSEAWADLDGRAFEAYYHAELEGRPSMTSQACYICGTAVGLGLPEQLSDGSVYVEGIDENDHAFCEPCKELVYATADATASWPSSEDSDLWRYNCAAEGLRRGRELRKE